MFWNKYLIPMSAALVAVAALNWIGSINHYYYTVTWYDWPVHFLGGAWAAIFILWALDLAQTRRLRRFLTLKNLVFMVFAIGLAWEIFELSFGITNFHDRGYLWDTTHDLLNDFLGACLVAYLARKSVTRPMEPVASEIK